MVESLIVNIELTDVTLVVRIHMDMMKMIRYCVSHFFIIQVLQLTTLLPAVNVVNHSCDICCFGKVVIIMVVGTKNYDPFDAEDLIFPNSWISWSALRVQITLFTLRTVLKAAAFGVDVTVRNTEVNVGNRREVAQLPNTRNIARLMGVRLRA